MVELGNDITIHGYRRQPTTTLDMTGLVRAFRDATRALHRWRLALPLSRVPLVTLGLQGRYRQETTPIYGSVGDDLLAQGVPSDT